MSTHWYQLVCLYLILRGLTCYSMSMQVLNKHHGNIPEGAIYVGRPSTWGNPFVVSHMWDHSGLVLTREEAIARFRVHATTVRLKNNPDWLVPLYEAEALVCWCAPLSCHADVLVELINANRR